MTVGRVNGYGIDSYQNVFMVVFDQSLSSAPTYHAWDNAQTFPATDSYGTTTAGRLFMDDAGTSQECRICLRDMSTTGAKGVIKGASVLGSNNPNRLYGSADYVTAAQIPVTTGTSYPAGYDNTIRWNMLIEVPSDFEPSDDMKHLLEVKYTYTGTAPTLAWYFNAYNADQATRESSPSWQTFTPQSEGIRHCSSGATDGGPYWANIPYTSTEDTVEGWIDDNSPSWP